MLANTKTYILAAFIVLLLFTTTTNLTAQTQSPEASLDKPLVATWQIDFARMTRLPPPYFEQHIYVASDDATISAVERRTGKQVWRTEVGGEISSPLKADGKSVFVSTLKSATIATGVAAGRNDGSLRCLSALSGLTQWVSDFSPSLVGDIELGKIHLFALDAKNTLFAFSKNTGAIVWSQQFSTKFVNRILTQNDLLFIGSESNLLYALDQQTGKTLWRRVISGKSKINRLASDARRIYVGTQDGQLAAFDLRTGAALWRKKQSGSIKSLATVGDQIIVATSNNVIYCVQAISGRRVWKRELAGRIAGSPAITRSAILIATVAGDDCVALQTSDGKIINTIRVSANVGLILHLILADETVVLVTDKCMIGYAPIR